MRTEEKKRLESEVKRLFRDASREGGGSAKPHLDPETAAFIYASWKAERRDLLRKSAARPPIPDDVCYVCQEGTVEWGQVLLELKCGHVIHEHCASQQLDSIQQEAGHLLSLANARCGICRQWLDAPLLNPRTSRFVAQYQLIAGIAKQKWAEEEAERAGLLSTGEIVKKMAFYTCYRCRKPFYGGRVECEQAAAPDPSLMLCDECLTMPVSRDNNCSVHSTEFIQWKCRWCCSPANFFCFNTTHFCYSCHEQYPNQTVTACPGQPHCTGDHPPNDGTTEFCMGCALCNDFAVPHSQPIVAQPDGPQAQPEGGAEAQPEGGVEAQPEGGVEAQPEGGVEAQPEGGPADGVEVLPDGEVDPNQRPELALSIGTPVNVDQKLQDVETLSTDDDDDYDDCYDETGESTSGSDSEAPPRQLDLDAERDLRSNRIY